MRARGSGDREYLTQDLSSLLGVVCLLQALGEQLGSVAKNTLGVVLHEQSLLRLGLSPSDKRLGVTPICDENALERKTSP